jgi:acetolactate decarboxylase
MPCYNALELNKRKVRTMKRILILVAFAGIFSTYLFGSQPDRDVLFQTSTINALLEGVYDGEISCGDLKHYGDFGIGTFQALDGEMIFVDGKIYQVKADGKVYCVPDTVKTPFAAVTFFDSDVRYKIQTMTNFQQLCDYLDSRIPTKNIFYAFKIEGTFAYIKTRSVPAQNKPYPVLTEVTKNQPVFEFNDIKGVIIGYRIPAFADKINVPGYHFHFISYDKTVGGHLLEMATDNANIEIDFTHRFYLSLPEESSFYQTDLSKDKTKELEKAEK